MHWDEIRPTAGFSQQPASSSQAAAATHSTDPLQILLSKQEPSDQSMSQAAADSVDTLNRGTAPAEFQQTESVVLQNPTAPRYGTGRPPRCDGQSSFSGVRSPQPAEALICCRQRRRRRIGRLAPAAAPPRTADWMHQHTHSHDSARLAAAVPR